MRLVALSIVAALAGAAHADVCTLAGDRWESSIRLGTRPGASPFAKLSPTADKAQLRLELGDGPVARLHVDADGVVLDALAPTADVHLFPKRPVQLDSWFTDLIEPLHLVPGAPGQLVVTLLSLPSQITTSRPLRATVGCADLSLTYVAVPAPARTGHETRKPAMLAFRRKIPLSLSADGEAVAHLRVEDDEDPIRIEVVETKGRSARIYTDEHGYVLEGWVPASAVVRFRALPLGNLGTIGLGGMGRPKLPLRRCGAEVVLSVAGANGPEKVGLLHAGVQLMTTGSDGDYAKIELLGPAWLVPFVRDIWRIAATDLARCPVE